MSVAHVIDGLFWLLAFLFSTSVHEAAHAYVAMRGGDPTAYRGGQVSLSPIPHIRREPIGMLVVPVITALTQGWAMGWASAPFDPNWAERHPRRAAWMAAAGPAANFALAAISWCALRIGLLTGFFHAPMRIRFSQLVVPGVILPAGLGEVAAQGLSVMFTLNLLLGVFNLLPMPPLDGASAVSLVLPEDTARQFRAALRSPQFSIVGLIVVWYLFPYIASPLLRVAVRTLYPDAEFG